MSSLPDGRLFTREHEWIEMDDTTIATIGITAFAAESLGDITFVQVPKEGEQIKKDDPFGVVESVKAVSDLYAPVTGRVVEVNEPVVKSPELLNEDPYNDGWLIKVEMKDLDELSELLSASDYEEYCEEKA